MRQAKKDRVAEVARGCKECFKDHEILERDETRKVPRYWWCGKPGSSSYSFQVTFIPWHVIVTGDLGLLVLRPSDADAFAWARSSIEDLEYFAGKAAHGITVEEWDRDLAIECLGDKAADLARDLVETGTPDTDQTLQLIRACSELATKLSDGEIGDAGAFGAAMLEAKIINDYDVPNCDNYTHEFLRCREGLRWLFARLDAEAKEVAGG